MNQKYYRQRLYQHYLTTQVQSEVETIHKDLRHRAPYLRSLIQRWFPKDRSIRVLDLGCGYGAFLYFLKVAGYSNLNGIDGSSEQVIAAMNLGIDCVQHGDIIELLKKSTDGSFDVLIAFDILEHLSKDEVLTVADESYRVLKNGGRLLIHVPNGEAIFSGAVFFSDLTHETGFTRRSIHQLMNAVGFTRLHIVEDVPEVHSIKSAMRYGLWKIFRALFHLIYTVETGDRGQDLVLSQNLLAIIVKE